MFLAGFFFPAVQLNAQPDRKGNTQSDTTAHQLISPFYQVENSLGLQFTGGLSKGPFLGLSLTKALYTFGEGSSHGMGAGLGAEYDFRRKTLSPKLDFWFNGFAYFIGGHIGGSAYYYRGVADQGMILRPMAGLNFYKLSLVYGINLYFGREYPALSRHSIGLIYYFSAWKFDQ
ncbi:MAG: hypothetical protein GYB31_02775 [Bacteroidetes bacterium]|nr:hypothetical protein [Bacteroidota bacterium]